MKIRELADMVWDRRLAVLRDMSPTERKEVADKLRMKGKRDHLAVHSEISRLKGYMMLMELSEEESERFWAQFEEEGTK